MFNVVNNIKITQRSSDKYPNRNRVLNLDFLTEYTVNSDWEHQTSTGTIVIPKNLYYKDESNAFNPLNGTKVNIGGFTDNPLLLRGDKVTLNAGYKYRTPSMVRAVDDTALLFEGYVSKVHSKIPIEFDIEDNMWLLKQTPMPTKTFTEIDTLESMLSLICDEVKKVHGVELTYNALSSTTFGAIMSGNETAAQFLNRLQRLYGFRSYFRGNELRSGIIVYYPSDAQEQVFIMNGQDGNIPADGQDLEYQRKDDLVLSAVAHNTITEETGATCKDGSKKTKHKRLEVLVSIKDGKKTTKVIEQGDRVPDNTEGERRTFFFAGAKTTDELATLAFQQLERYYYDGLKGSFQTFGIPYVKHGDHVRIKNPKLPEQDGLYKVRGVEYTGGTNGLRQRITLDFKIS